MSKQKMTPWFPASVKPVRVGWYQVRGYGFVDGRTVMRYWTGDEWQWASPFHGMTFAAVNCTYTAKGKRVEDRWRGLTADAVRAAKESGR